MKKISFLLLFFLGIAASSEAWASAATVNGSADLKDATYDSLEVNGMLAFKDLSVKEALIVNGSASGKGLNCAKLEVNGSAHIELLRTGDLTGNGSFIGKNIEVKGKTEIDGSLEITKGKLNSVKLAVTQAIFADTEISGDIIIEKLKTAPVPLGVKPSPIVRQIIELRGDSVVTGDIKFEGEGEIRIYDGAAVKGVVLNGNIEKR